MTDKTLPPEGLDEFLAASPPVIPPPTPISGDTGALTQPISSQTAATPPPAGLDDFVAEEMLQEKYGTPGQQAIAGLEGLAKGLAGPLATGAERALGVDPEGIEGRRAANPLTSYGAEAVGLVGPAVVSGGLSAAATRGVAGAAKLAEVAGAVKGFSQAGLLEKAGAAGAAAVGLGAPVSAAAKIGSAAVKGFIENAAFQGGDEVSKLILGDPSQSLETALVNTGLSGLIGGGVMSAVGSVAPLWKATMGGKTTGLLEAFSRRLGGIDGVIPESMDDAIAKSGLSLEPEVRAALSDIPEVQQAFKTLQQSDTTKSGLKFQKTMEDFKGQVSESLINTMGRTTDEALKLPDELSTFEAGKNIGKTLADEYEAQLSPIAHEFEALKDKYAQAPLFERGPTPEFAVPGTSDTISDKIAKLAESQGWTVSPSSDIMKEVRRTIEEVPKLKTLNDLSNFITAVGNNTASPLPFGQQTPLSRAGSMIRGVLKDVQDEVAIQQLGKEAPELVERYRLARKHYRDMSGIREALDGRLKTNATTSGFAKALRNMAQTDGESIINRMSGKGDADLIQFLQAKFPSTAEGIRKFHADNILKSAILKDKAGETLNANALLRAMDKLEPELKAFMLTPESLDRIKATATILKKLEKLPHNFSNTARTLDKLLEFMPGTATGVATLLTGHSAPMALLIGALTKAVAKDVPDATRLALLKFLGSNKTIEPGAFKSLVEFVDSAVKGETLISRASKNLFRAGVEVLPAAAMATDRDRKRLDKALKDARDNPAGLLPPASGDDANHAQYLEGESAAGSQVAANAVTYLNGLRPEPVRRSPLDTMPVVPAAAKAAYDRALNVAQQPLTVLDFIKKGTLTPADVLTMRTIYPALYKKLQNKLTADVIDASAKGQSIPYKTRISLSMFLGQPLDSTLTPEAILAAQPLPKAAPTTQKASNALSKTADLYRTPLQESSRRSQASHR